MDVQGLENEAQSAIAGASTLEELDEARVRYLGRKSALKQALREVRDPESGRVLNTLREQLEQAVAEREARLSGAELERRLVEEQVDVTLPGRATPRGQLHLVTQVRREVEDIFLGLGYRVVDGREVETTHYNFDALNLPTTDPARSHLQSLFLNDHVVLRTETSPSQIHVMEEGGPPVYMISIGRVYRRETPDATHSARSPRDTFFFDEAIVLRTETSPSQIHVMEEKPPPIYMVSIGRCYRPDAIDAAHYPIFHQFEGLAVDKGLTLADLKGTLLHVMRALYGEERRVRFRTHYFPFTEPSIEPDVSCGICGGEGCRVCKHSGWIEMGGSGMVDPAVFENVGYDPEEWTGFAFGMGLERSAQLRHAVPGLRPFWENDLRVLRQF